VRLAAVKVFGSLSYNLLLSRINKSILSTLGQRAKDKKAPIRIEAMQVLAGMWNLAYEDMSLQLLPPPNNSASGQVAATETFSWIPSAILSTMYINDREINSTLYKVFYTTLVPLTITDDVLRTRRLLIFASQLDTYARTAFDSFPLRQSQSQSLLLKYLDAAEKFNGGTEAAEGKSLDSMCWTLGTVIGNAEGAEQRTQDLKKWAVNNDRRGFRLLRDLTDPNKDAKTSRKAQVCVRVAGLMLERSVD
jgi:sister chromatid cohesion protein PDS5